MPAPQQRPETLMQAIIAASADASVDVGKISALVQLHQQLQARDWEQRFNAAMADCQAALEPVRKNQINPDTKSRYADLAKLAEGALPIIHAHGFAITFAEVTSPKEGHIGVAVRVSHRDGHVERSEFHVPLDLCGFKGTPNKSSVHGWGSSLTYCRRYSLLAAFNIIVAGDDDGNAGGRANGTISGAQVTAVKKLAAEVRADVRRFCAYLGVPSIEAIPAGQFERAIAALETKRRVPA